MLTSEIPPEHPHKVAIEARLHRLLATLGYAWRASILIENRSYWGVCLCVVQAGRIARLWSTSLAPEEQHPAAFEAWLRSLGLRLQKEMDLDVGLRAVGELTPHLRAELQELVEYYHGGLTRDGHIVVSRNARPAFLDAADALGLQLEIGLWPKRRLEVYARPRTRRSLS